MFRSMSWSICSGCTAHPTTKRRSNPAGQRQAHPGRELRSPDEAEKIKSKIRESGSYKVIDKVTVKLNEKRDVYEALMSNLGVKNAEISDAFVRQFEKLLVGGIWCIVTLHYRFEENQKGHRSW
jgi:predicted ATP-dependent Lon-type protease